MRNRPSEKIDLIILMRSEDLHEMNERPTRTMFISVNLQ